MRSKGFISKQTCPISDNISFISLHSPSSPVTIRRNIWILTMASVRVPDFQPEGFESRRRQVGGPQWYTHRDETWAIVFTLHRLLLPTSTGQRGRVNTNMQSTTKPWLPGPSGTERIYDQGGGSGQLGLRAGGAKNLWVKMSHRKRVCSDLQRQISTKRFTHSRTRRRT